MSTTLSGTDESKRLRHYMLHCCITITGTAVVTVADAKRSDEVERKN